MRPYAFILVVCLYITGVYCQDFHAVDLKVQAYPKDYAAPEQLAAQIKKDFTKDEEKVRAVYYWLASNISYDMDAYFNDSTYVSFTYVDAEDFRRKSAAIDAYCVRSTFKKRRAVCEGFAQSFRRVCELLKIPCKVVGGFSKTDASEIGTEKLEEDHVWNAVRIGGEWYLLDATWGAGYSEGKNWVQKFDDFYFFTDPETFSLSHLPSEPVWAFTRKRINKRRFYNAPVFKKAFFNHKLQLVYPLSGIVRTHPGSTMRFVLENLDDGNALFYSFKGDKPLKPAQVECEGKKCKFSIPFSEENKDTELVLFYNKQPILKYKIDREN